MDWREQGNRSVNKKNVDAYTKNINKEQSVICDIQMRNTSLSNVWVCYIVNRYFDTTNIWLTQNAKPVIHIHVRKLTYFNR